MVTAWGSHAAVLLLWLPVHDNGTQLLLAFHGNSMGAVMQLLLLCLSVHDNVMQP
jgi:hypothetical protein